jgi:hypothetical protein
VADILEESCDTNGFYRLLHRSDSAVPGPDLSSKKAHDFIGAKAQRAVTE